MSVQAGIATYKALHDSTADEFMNIMRVNALSYVAFG